MEVIVTREYLISLLQAWKEDKITASDLIDIMFMLYADPIVLDWESNESLSVTMEVLDLFESIDVNLIIKDDIDSYIEFLHTPLGEFEEGNKKLSRYEAAINYEDRKKKLRGIAPYSSIYG